MAQRIAKIIDVTKTFLPVDPQNFPANLHTTAKEDYPEKTLPVVAYEGYNFLPTHYGYKSFFGTTGKFDVSTLAARVDKLLVFQGDNFQNYLVALTETGIYTNTGDTAAVWVQAVALDAPAVGTHRNWTWCVLGNTLYMYRAQEASYWKLSGDTAPTITAIAPTFLTMSGQRGIFKAGGRLGMWDSEDSVAWSSLDDHADFEPSIETLAGSAIFDDVQGRITIIQSYGDGFIIYATNSIVGIERDLAATFQWKPRVLMAGSGIAYPEQIAVASPDTTQYAYTAIGMRKIERGQVDEIITEITDLLQESTSPVLIELIGNRYLVFRLTDSSFVEGLVQFESVTYQHPSYNYSSGLSLSDISGMSASQAAKLYSLGHFDEQQALADSLIASLGMPERNFAIPAQPRWKYTFVSREPFNWVEDPVTHELYVDNITVNVASDFPSFTTFDAPVPSNYATLVPAATVNAKRTPVVASLELIAEGEQAVFEFFKQQKAFWDASAAEAVAAFNTAFSEAQAYAVTYESQLLDRWGNVSDPLPPSSYPGNTVDLGYARRLTDHKETRFEFGPCSGKAFCTLGKAERIFVATQADDADINPSTGRKKIAVRAYRQEGLISPTAGEPIIEATIEVAEWDYTDNTGAFRTISALACGIPTSSSWLEPLDWTYEPDTPPVITTSPWVTSPLDTPPSTVTFQDGDPGPIYPSYVGALVYDTELKKWGKMKLAYKALIDLSPINTFQGKIVTAQRFGIEGGAIKADGFIYRFDGKPTDSYIKYGKLGYYRAGMSTLEQVAVHFRTPSTGTLEIEASLDGRNIETGFSNTTNFVDATSITGYPSLAGRWHNITLRGNYDITYLEYLGYASGRR